MSKQQKQSFDWSGSDNILFVLIGILFAGGFLFGLAGQIAALVFNGQWPAIDFDEFFPILPKVLSNPGDPAAAWPESQQHLIPGAFAFYFTLFALIAIGFAIAVGIKRLWTSMTEGGSGQLGQENSAWASKRSLKVLEVPRSVPGRLTLGKAHGKLIATEPKQSVIVMGPTQSGKTTGLAVPAILEWEGPVIATSVKNDLVQDTINWREKQGNVWIYDPTASTQLPAATWSPLDGARDWLGAKRIASWLVGAAQSDKSGLQDANFWYSAAGKLLAPHLFAAAANGYTMADVVRWIDTQEDFELRALLQAAGVEEAIVAAEASWQREERAKSSIYTTAEVVIEAYSDPTVLASARTSDVRPQRFLDGGHHTLYVCAPGHEQARLRPVFSTLLKQFITAAYEQSFTDYQRAENPPLLIVIDEAANIAPLNDLDALASTAAGHGVQIVTVWQDLSQITARYGDRAQTVVNNHRAKVVLSGISDTATLDYASRLIGSQEVKQTSYTTDGQGQRSSTQSLGDKNLAPSDVLRRIRPNEGVLVYGFLLPARLQLRPWYKSKDLRGKSTGQAEAPNREFNKYDEEESGGSDTDGWNQPGPPRVERDSYRDYLRQTQASGARAYDPAEQYGQRYGERYAETATSDRYDPALEDLFDFSDFEDDEDETTKETKRFTRE